MVIHGNHTRNVQITKSGHPCKKLICKTFAQPWILPSQTHTRIMATCMETHFIHIGSERFVIGYVGQEHADHLMSALKMYYENIRTYWEGELYCVIKIKWNYTKRYVDILMPRYKKKALHQFVHKKPKKPQHQPYQMP